MKTAPQLYRTVGMMNPGSIVDLMILIGTNKVSRCSGSEEGQWEAKIVCLRTSLWQKCQCTVLTVCTIPMNIRKQSVTARRHNESVVRWNNKRQNLVSRNAGKSDPIGLIARNESFGSSQIRHGWNILREHKRADLDEPCLSGAVRLLRGLPV